MKDVYFFTLKQNMKGKGFKIATFLIPLILFIIGIAITIGMAGGNSDENDSFKVTKLYVNNESELIFDDFDYYGVLPWEKGKNVPKNEDTALLLNITDGADGICYNLSVPENSVLKTDDAKKLMPSIDEYMNIIIKADMIKKDNPLISCSDEELFKACTPVVANYVTVGDENANLGASLFKMIGPMLIVFVLYFMSLVYGQTIGKTVISEKVSKLMETLLVTVKPGKLISGKILAMFSIAILQMSLWIVCFVAGFVAGHYIALWKYGEYTNIILQIIEILRDGSNGPAFSVTAVVLSILVLFIAFLFLCVLAGMVSAPVSKAEELSSFFSIYQVIVVVGFMISYIIPLKGGVSPFIDRLLHIVPVTSVFMLPSDILIGNLTRTESITYTAILAVFTAILAVYTGKIYKARVFYNDSGEGTLKRFLKI